MRKLFEQEYVKIEKSLFLVAIGYLRNTEDSKDAVQEAVVCAYRSFGNLKHKEYFKTWITRIVINKCKDFLKKRKYTTELNDNLNSFYDMPAEDFEIMEAICGLDSKTALYITLRFYNDMTYEEMSKVVKLPVSTVKYKTAGALKKLRKIMEGDEV